MNKRLTELEAERVIAIMDDTVEKLSFLGSITPDVLQHRDELSKFIGDEISRTMDEQREMEKEYERLIELRAELKGLANKNKYKDVQERVSEISRGLRESTSKLVASLKENPNVSGNMIKVDRDRKEALDLFLKLNMELREKGTCLSLTNKVGEEDASIFKLQQLHARDKELTESIAKLESTLKTESDSFQRSSKERKETIISLKEEIHRFKGNTSTSTQFKRRESLAKVSSVVRDFKLAERVYELRLQELDGQSKTEQIVNNQSRQFLQRKQQSLLEDINKWDSKFEAESNEREKALKSVLQQRALLLEKLTALQERKKLEIADEKLREERELADRELEKHRQEVTRQKMAAANAIYKMLSKVVIRAREQLALKDTKKKKKKGEGKKK